MVKTCAIFLKLQCKKMKSQCKKLKSPCKKVKSAADWLLKYTLHFCPIRCSYPKINKNPDVYKLFRPTRKMASRFHTTSSTEIQTLKDKTRNKNTDHSTNTWTRIFKGWASERGQNEELSSYVPSDLDEVLVNFYAEQRKVDGQEYEPACLRVMRSSLDRYLKEKNYPVSIISSDKFKGSNKVLEGRAKDLRDKGMGNRLNRSLPLTTQEEEILWQCGQLGHENAQSLINSLWWLMTQHFGLRRRQEHPFMLEDLKVHTGDDGERYYILSEKRTKTRQGGLTKKDRKSSPKLFEIGGPRCFFVLLDIFK